MVEIILPIAIVGILAYLVVALLRFFEVLVLSSIVKKAMHDHPESVAALIDKIGAPRRNSGALAGWLLLAAAAAMVLYALVFGRNQCSGSHDAGDLSRAPRGDCHCLWAFRSVLHD